MLRRFIAEPRIPRHGPYTAYEHQHVEHVAPTHRLNHPRDEHQRERAADAATGEVDTGHLAALLHRHPRIDRPRHAWKTTRLARAKQEAHDEHRDVTGHPS